MGRKAQGFVLAVFTRGFVFFAVLRTKKLFMFCVEVVVADAHGANSHPCEVAPYRPVRGAIVLGTYAEHKSF